MGGQGSRRVDLNEASGSAYKQRMMRSINTLLRILVLVACAAATQAQPVQGRVAAVGFAAGSASVIREGQWFPILATLSAQGDRVWSGELRVIGIDLDGDRVAFTRRQVTVSADVGSKRVWCYAIVNAANEFPTDLDVLDEDAVLVERLPLPPAATILNDDLLVLDISRTAIPGLKSLETRSWSPGQTMEGERPYYRNVVVARLPGGASDLPDRWWGLEAVDIILWDEPAPSALSIGQMDALLEWVRCGGQLIVGVGPTWSAIRKSDLAAIMPLEGPGPTTETRDLRGFIREMVPSQPDLELDDAIAVTTAQPFSRLFRVRGERNPAGAEVISLIALRPVGSGRVVTTAARFRDLTSLPIDTEAFFGTLFDLNRYTPKFREHQLEQSAYGTNATPLYDSVAQVVGFTARSAVGGLIAMLFVATYIVLATVVSWWWLRRRQLTHWSWTIFAGFAMVASVLSLGTVSGVRGVFSRGVHSLCIVDLESGSTAARGPCFFGYSSPIRQRADLSLPGETDFLRSLPRGPRQASYYITPEYYEGVPTEASLDRVLMRATLKQVEGYWHGEVDGTIQADLMVSRRTGRLSPGSWVSNELPVDLEGGVLLFIDPRHRRGVPWHASGLDEPYALSLPAVNEVDLRKVPPAFNVLAVQLPQMVAGERLSGLGQPQYAEVDKQWVKWSGLTKRRRSTMPDLRTLWHEHQAWLPPGALHALGGSVHGKIFLASTRSFHLHSGASAFDSVARPVTTEGLAGMDVSHWLTRWQAVLLCWSNEPGPARLHRNGSALETNTGLTVYRVRIPIRYEGEAVPAGETL